MQLSEVSGVAWLELGLSDDPLRTPEVRVDGDAVLPIIGVPAGASMPWRAVLRDDAGQLHHSEIGRVRIPDAPEPLHTVQLEHGDPGAELASGWLFTSVFEGAGGSSHAVVLDGDGRVVWWAAGEPGVRIVRVRPSIDGQSILWAAVDLDKTGGDLGKIVRQRLDGTLAPEMVEAPFLHHDFLEDADGGLRWLSHVFDRVALDEAILLSPVATDALVHRPASGDEAVVFDFFEDFPVEPWWVCDHMSAGRFVAQHFEWTHGNSLLERPDGDGWWVMARYLDALVHIGADGTFRSQLGGRDSTWTLPDEAQFVHAHASHAFDDRLLVFDNGDSHDPDAPLPVSRLLELQLDPTTQVASIAWSLDHPDGAHTAILGDAQRLVGGHTLASWGGQGRVTEVDDGGTILWDLSIPDAVVARVVFVPELAGAGR